MFSGEVVIITGAASGIGYACASAYAHNGCRGVVIADVQQKKGEEAAKKLREETGTDVLFIYTDVSNENSVRNMVQTAIDRWGKIDILVNNASICPVVKWDDVTLESWNTILQINLTGMFLCTKEVGVHFKKQRKGKFLFITSTAALDGSHVAHPAYGVTKAGAVNLMKAVAKEFTQFNVVSNCIMCGPVKTPLSNSFSPEIQAHFAESNLMKRYGEASEIAQVVLFVTGPQNTYMCGAVVQVSGGEIIAG